MLIFGSPKRSSMIETTREGGQPSYCAQTAGRQAAEVRSNERRGLCQTAVEIAHASHWLEPDCNHPLCTVQEGPGKACIFLRSIVHPLSLLDIVKPRWIRRVFDIVEPTAVARAVEPWINRGTRPPPRVHLRVPKPNAAVRRPVWIEPSKCVTIYPGVRIRVEGAEPFRI